MKKTCHAVVLCFKFKEFQKALFVLSGKIDFPSLTISIFLKAQLSLTLKTRWKYLKTIQITILSKIDFHFRGPK